MATKKTNTSPEKTTEITEETKVAGSAKADVKSEPVAEKKTTKRGRKPAKKAETAPVADTPVMEGEEVKVDVEVAPVEAAPAPVEEAPVKEEKKPAAKKSTAKKTPAKKTATKTATKTTAKKTAAKKKVETPVVEEKAPAKKTTAKKTTASVNVFFQYQGTETAELVEQAKKLSGVKSPKSVNLYIKPEDGMVYYVVDDIAGSFELK